MREPRLILDADLTLLFVVLQAKMRFVELVYVLATEEAERIGVDHVARVSAGDSREGSMGKYFSCQSVIQSKCIHIRERTDLTTGSELAPI